VRVVRVERLRETKTLCSRQVIYAITSIPCAMMDETALLKLARDHWQIENRLFRVRDGTFQEDACRVRDPATPPSRWPISATPFSRPSEAETSRQNQRAKPSPQIQRPPSAS
jgi:hypothetical protein